MSAAAVAMTTGAMARIASCRLVRAGMRGRILTAAKPSAPGTSFVASSGSACRLALVDCAPALRVRLVLVGDGIGISTAWLLDSNASRLPACLKPVLASAAVSLSSDASLGLS
jgi:hypothetical protein